MTGSTIASVTRLTAVAGLIALASAGAALAQTAPRASRARVAATVGGAGVTTWGHRGLDVGAEVAYDLAPRLTARASVDLYRSADTETARLLDVSGWHDQTHLTATAGLTAAVVRTRLLGTELRVGPTAALAGRRVDDRFHRGTFYPVYFEGQGGLAETVAAEWAAGGPGYVAHLLTADDGPGGRQDGVYLALEEPVQRTDVGAEVGLDAVVRAGPWSVGVRAVHRRFLDQEPNTGSHAYAVAVRVGHAL